MQVNLTPSNDYHLINFCICWLAYQQNKDIVGLRVICNINLFPPTTPSSSLHSSLYLICFVSTQKHIFAEASLTLTSQILINFLTQALGSWCNLHAETEQMLRRHSRGRISKSLKVPTSGNHLCSLFWDTQYQYMFKCFDLPGKARIEPKLLNSVPRQMYSGLKFILHF